MGFLNILLLLGGLAFVVPLIIHLLNRSKFQTVEWGAMHLLDNIEQQNSKRIQWHAWLLLLLRCLLPLVLSACMARPIWNWWTSNQAGGSATTILVIDNSFSMHAPSQRNLEQPSSVFAQVQADIQQHLRQVGGRGAKSIVTSGDGAKLVTEGVTHDPRIIQRQLERVGPTARSSDPVAALRLAIEAAAKSPDPYRQILVWSDFQKHDWEQVSPATWQQLETELRDLPVPASVHFFPQRAESHENLSLVIDSETTEVTLVGEALEVRATIFNHGRQAAKAIPIRVFLAEAEIAAQRVDVPAGGQLQTSFLVALDEPGIHSVTLAMDDPSGITGDDTDDLKVEVLSPLKILLVEERNDLPLLELETGFLQVAWQATFREDGQPLGLSLQRVSPNRLTSGLLSASDVVVLANVSRLPDDVARQLAERVAAGLVLFVFGGDHIDRSWYEQTWGQGASPVILPFAYGEPIDAQQWLRSADPATTENLPTAVQVMPPPYSDVALSLFNDPQQGRLDQVSAKRWHRFDSTTEQSLHRDAVVLLKLTDDTPLLAKLAVEKGVVYQWSVRANDSWSNLPVRPVYWPLMQRLLLYSQAMGEPRAVGATRQEAKHDPMSDDEIAAMAAKLGADVHADAVAFSKSDSQRRTGWEIWRWVLLGVLLVLFGELLVEKKITRGAA